MKKENNKTKKSIHYAYKGEIKKKKKNKQNPYKSTKPIPV